MAKTTRKPSSKKVDALKHDKARRINVPTAELQSLAEQQEEIDPRPPVHYPRTRPLTKGETRERDTDLDPQIVWNGIRITLTKEQAAQLAETGTVEIGDAQLVWRGKDRQDWSDLVVNAPMLYVQEKVQPKAILDELKRQSDAAREATSDAPDLFADFNGLADPEARAEFYQHSMHWQNRMILGDSLHRTLDIHLNDDAMWTNIPVNVWNYTLGGYQVIKKWLSYREASILGRALKPDEMAYVSEMVRRIAAILLLGRALDENYEAAKMNAAGWREGRPLATPVE
jgi:hypothetical protein